MKNIAMRIMYDGSNYHGWQRQKNAITIQEVVEKALSETLSEEIQVNGCSRTDAGVHALEYIMNFGSETCIPIDKIPYTLNYKLGNDISVVDSWQVSKDFHARFSSHGKEYVYKLWNSKLMNPFECKYSWHIPYKLNIESMIECAKYFIGTHDFAGFKGTRGDQITTVRTIRKCHVEIDPFRTESISITVEADAFLYNMVRIIVGTIVAVGFGRIKPTDIQTI
ncbi:MAG: tRNA pseudouridine(38-40) synthase TruA, partial [Oscillospiraceae bacterium]